MNRLILAADGRPFPNWDAATNYHDRLAADLGPQVQMEVVPHPDGGYALQWNMAGADQTRSALPASVATPTYPRIFLLRRALRADIAQFLGIALGVWMLWAPREFLSWGWGAQGELDALPYLGQALRVLTCLIGGLLVIDGVGQLLWRYLATRYRVDETTVCAEVWSLGRDGLRSERQYLPLSRVRRIESRQHLGERLLGVGSVTLLAADSDRVDLVLHGVVAPKNLRNELMRRAGLSQGSNGQLTAGLDSAPPALPVVPSDAPQNADLRSVTRDGRAS